MALEREFRIKYFSKKLIGKYAEETKIAIGGKFNGIA